MHLSLVIVFPILWFYDCVVVVSSDRYSVVVVPCASVVIYFMLVRASFYIFHDLPWFAHIFYHVIIGVASADTVNQYVCRSFERLSPYINVHVLPLQVVQRWAASYCVAAIHWE